MIAIRKINENLSMGILDMKLFSSENNILVKREQEKAGTRFLLQNLLPGSHYHLVYNERRKPFLENSGKHISISHSHDKLVILLNDKENTGVDIELIRDKVLRIRHKFVNPGEADFTGNDPEKLIMIWAAKEAMYKYYGEGNIDFLKNLFVERVVSGYIFGKIETPLYTKRLKLAVEKTGDYILVYILNELPD